MELLMSVAIGILFSISVYMMLSNNLLRVVFGTVLISHGAHLLLITMAQLKRGAPPILGEGVTQVVDPLPHALILTSIVISFGVTAFLLVLSYQTYRAWNSDDLIQLKGEQNE